MTESQTIEITAEFERSGSKARVHVVGPGGRTLSDRVDVVSMIARRRFAARVVQLFPAIELDTVEEILQQKADEFERRSLRDGAAPGLSGADAGTTDAGDETGSGDANQTKAAALVRIASDQGIRLFRSTGSAQVECFAIVPGQGHHAVWSMDDEQFSLWLRYLYFNRTRDALSDATLKSAIALLRATALFEGERHETFLRVGHANGKMYLDLGGDDWTAVEVDEAGWRLVDPISKGIHFVRRGGMQPLPTPVENGTVDELRPLCNVSDDDWVMVKAFMFMCLHPRGPYPILNANGRKGGAKSTLCKMVRCTVDANLGELRRPPACEDDLAVAAHCTHVLAFDNLSSLPDWLSDALCCLSTGGALSKRMHYSNAGEALLRYRRPVILSGIENAVVASDLAERCISITFQRIDRRKRMTESEVLARFEEMHARVLGALLTAMSEALRRRDEVRLEALPRMADFCQWVVRAAPALGFLPAEFLRIYWSKAEAAESEVLENSPLGLAVVALVRRSPGREWIGQAKDLIEAVGNVREKGWPWLPRRVGGALRRLAAALEGVGVEVIEPPETARPRNWVLRCLADDEVGAVATIPATDRRGDRREESPPAEVAGGGFRRSDGSDGCPPKRAGGDHDRSPRGDAHTPSRQNSRPTVGTVGPSGPDGINDAPGSQRPSILLSEPCRCGTEGDDHAGGEWA